MTRRARLVLPLIAAAALGSCRSRPAEDPSRVQPTYDERTGRLRQLAYDSNGDGRMDTWTYMDGARALRAEIDKDQDGRIERWEYYDDRQQVIKVGISRLNDAREDAWMYPGPDGRIARLEVSTGRDGVVDRWEFYANDTLTRVDADTDRNGRVDKWEEHDGSRVTAVSFDENGDGRPDRRLIYGEGGAVTAIESAPDATGRFTRRDQPQQP